MTRLHAFPNFGKPAGWADRRRDASRQGRTSCSSVRSMLRGTSSPALMIESQGRAAEQQDTDKVGPIAPYKCADRAFHCTADSPKRPGAGLRTP